MNKKNIAIFGKNSYIGTNLQKRLEEEKDKYNIEVIESKGEEWKKINFSKYDTIYMVAGIAHVSADPKIKDIYYKVNKELPIEVAKKAKKDKTKQFIFMSSMIIYGRDGKIDEERVITNETEKKPIDFYGKSKLEADEELQKFNSNDFKVAIIRTPMVYGNGCKGNFPKLKKIAEILPIFPNIENQRSMIYIENLCEAVKQIIDDEKSGIFYPQNKEYVSTKEIVETMAKIMNKKIFFVKIFNPILRVMSRKINYINKVFGNKVYEKELSGDYSYCRVEFEESIRRSIE